MSDDGTIANDVPPEFDVDGVAEALFKRWRPEKEAATEAKAEATPEDEGDAAPSPEETSADESSEEDAAKDDEAPARASDDHVVEIEVNGEKHAVPVKDLKRLWGQEAALTQKSQAVATARQQAEEFAAKYSIGLTKLLERAKERFAPFEKIDWEIARVHLSPDEVTQLRNMHNAFKADVDFLTNELDQAKESAVKEQQAAVKAQADACLKALTTEDSPYFIKGFDENLYNEMRSFAASQGMSAQVMDNILDPVAFVILHKAMLYDRAQSAAATKLAKAPKNVNKTPTNSRTVSPNAEASRRALEKLRTSGDVDDAANALLAKWNTNSE